MGKVHARGVTLLELLVVISIIGILAAVAYPSYQEQARKSRRSDAKAMLMQVAQQQERWFTKNRTYAPSMTALGYDADSEPSPQGYYNVAITNPGCTTFVVNATIGVVNAVNTCFLVTASATGSQASDTACQPMTINELGNKAPADCW